MSYKCNRCDVEVEKFGVSYGMALDFDDDQSDEPAHADMDRGHLCLSCRDEYREFLNAE